MKGTDKEWQEGSEEVYNYLLCAVGPLEGEYEPGLPEAGFLYPAFRQANDQLSYGHGYDHNFVLDKERAGLEKIATAYSTKSGIKMDVITDCIGMQLYTANFIQGQKVQGGAVCKERDAFCLETQYFPNSINEPNFTTPLTEAGKSYDTKTVYAFSIA